MSRPGDYSEVPIPLNEVEAATALGAALAEPWFVDETPFAIVPKGYEAQDLSHFLIRPPRKKGLVIYRDLNSFCVAFKDQKIDEESKIYGNKVSAKFKAIFNDNGLLPGWGDHIATYECPWSVEWIRWKANDKLSMTQEKFAQFIEDNSPDCVSPDSATMIEISRTLEAKKKVNFASGIRLSNGQNELTYEEEITGTSGKGRLQVPETFSIGISVFEGGPRWNVTARLRYRIADKGVLTMSYDLDRPHKVVEEAVNEVWAAIEAETGVTILNGNC